MLQQAIDLTQRAFASTKKTSEHSLRVLRILEEKFHVTDEEILAAGVTHDLLEDTDVTDEELEAVTSARVLGIVRECSHPKEATRAEKLAFYQQLSSISKDAQIVKLADYLANLEWNREVIQRNELDRYPFLKEPTEYMQALKLFLDACRATYPEATALVTEAMKEVEDQSRASRVQVM